MMILMVIDSNLSEIIGIVQQNSLVFGVEI
jgi:hypothetical protein